MVLLSGRGSGGEKMFRQHIFIPTQETCTFMIGNFAFQSPERMSLLANPRKVQQHQQQDLEPQLRMTDLITGDTRRSKMWSTRVTIKHITSLSRGSRSVAGATGCDPMNVDITLEERKDVCLGCYLKEVFVHRFRWLGDGSTESIGRATLQDLVRELFPDDIAERNKIVGYISVFPRRMQHIAMITSMTPHRCDTCLDHYRVTGTWLEAGVEYDPVAVRVVNPVIVPFDSGNFRAHNEWHSLRDAAFECVWPVDVSPIPVTRRDVGRRFGRQSFAMAVARIGYLAMWQNNKHIRVVLRAVLAPFSELVTSFFRLNMTSGQIAEALRSSVMWSYEEQFVVNTLIDAWGLTRFTVAGRLMTMSTSTRESVVLGQAVTTIQERQDLAESVRLASEEAAEATPRIQSAQERLDTVARHVLSIAEPLRTDDFFEVVRQVCFEHLFAPHGDVWHYLLKADARSSLMGSVQQEFFEPDWMWNGDPNRPVVVEQAQSPALVDNFELRGDILGVSPRGVDAAEPFRQIDNVSLSYFASRRDAYLQRLLERGDASMTREDSRMARFLDGEDNLKIVFRYYTRRGFDDEKTPMLLLDEEPSEVLRDRRLLPKYPSSDGPEVMIRHEDGTLDIVAHAVMPTFDSRAHPIRQVVADYFRLIAPPSVLRSEQTVVALDRLTSLAVGPTRATAPGFSPDEETCFDEGSWTVADPSSSSIVSAFKPMFEQLFLPGIAFRFNRELMTRILEASITSSPGEFGNTVQTAMGTNTIVADTIPAVNSVMTDVFNSALLQSLPPGAKASAIQTVVDQIEQLVFLDLDAIRESVWTALTTTSTTLENEINAVVSVNQSEITRDMMHGDFPRAVQKNLLGIPLAGRLVDLFIPAQGRTLVFASGLIIDLTLPLAVFAGFVVRPSTTLDDPNAMFQYTRALDTERGEGTALADVSRRRFLAELLTMTFSLIGEYAHSAFADRSRLHPMPIPVDVVEVEGPGSRNNNDFPPNDVLTATRAAAARVHVFRTKPSLSDQKLTLDPTESIDQAPLQYHQAFQLAFGMEQDDFMTLSYQP